MALSQTFRQAVLNGSATPTPLRELGLSGRSNAYLDEGVCAMLVDRKSRFLRKDAELFVDVLAAARHHAGHDLAGVVFIRKAPVCSQARAWLEGQGITVETVDA
jgi:hypothetical protein